MRVVPLRAPLLLATAALVSQDNLGVALFDAEDAHQHRVQFRTDTKTLAATPREGVRITLKKDRKIPRMRRSCKTAA